MAAIKRVVKAAKPRDLVSELNHWRKIRLDCPWRKNEAMQEIDKLLEELWGSKQETPLSVAQS